jgi:hypothetical protein
MAKRSKQELDAFLVTQRKALAVSSIAYDNGEIWESERLSATVYTLVYDHGSIVSLLTQLGVMTSLSFVSTGRIDADPKLLFAFPALVSMTPDGKGGHDYIPALDHRTAQTKLVDFETWWKKETVYFDKDEGTLSRSSLVFALGNQDGGRHIGELKNDAYITLKGGAGMTNVPSGTVPIKAVTASMRQIAWEVAETLKQLDGAAS